MGIIVIYYARQGPRNRVSSKITPVVTIANKDGRFNFYVKGKPVMVKGGAGYSFMDELAGSGGNTVMCWDTAALDAVLNQAKQNNLHVIIGLSVPGPHLLTSYKDEKFVAALHNSYSKIVLRYKDHPAILAWCLGNELIFPYSPVYDSFYKCYNKLLAMIHSSDPNHPVCTTVINADKKNIFNIHWRIPALDFIGFNIYNSLRNFQSELDFFKLIWDGPYFVSEWAPIGGWEAPVTSWEAPLEKNSTEKAAAYYSFYKQYMPVKDPRFLGSLVFYWGNRQEYTHTFYSIFDKNGIPTEIKEALHDCWAETLTNHLSPAISVLKMDDSLVARHNILLNAGSPHNALIELPAKQRSDSLTYSWQIFKEGWSLWGETWANFKTMSGETGLVADSTRQQINFVAPLKQGPYRIFVTVYNGQGYCATANMPFYVIK